MTDLLKYTDDTDRSYGVAGMAVSAFIFDKEEYIASVSTERRDFEAVEFTPEFFIASADGLLPKAQWKHTLHQLELISSMLISNVMSRSMVRNRQELDIAHHDAMLDVLADYATDCQLDDDEMEELFNSQYQYLNRAYHNSRVHDIIKYLVDKLSTQHTLNHSDLRDILSGM